MGDGSTERGEAEPKEHGKDFKPASRSGPVYGRGVLLARSTSMFTFARLILPQPASLLRLARSQSKVVRPAEEMR